MKKFSLCFALFFFTSSLAFSSFKSEKQQIRGYCDKTYQQKMEMRPGSKYPSPKASYITELQSNPQKTNYYVLCLFLTGFKSGFDQYYRKAFEAKKKAKISDAELNSLQDQFGELIYADAPAVKSRLVTASFQDAFKYADSKMRILLQNFGK